MSTKEIDNIWKEKIKSVQSEYHKVNRKLYFRELNKLYGKEKWNFIRKRAKKKSGV